MTLESLMLGLASLASIALAFAIPLRIIGKTVAAISPGKAM
ncbi:MAG: hypothetical protein AAFY11_16345 [Cyanobacteria bacterium J06641_5]